MQWNLEVTPDSMQSIYIDDGSEDGSINELLEILNKVCNLFVFSNSIIQGKGFEVSPGIIKAAEIRSFQLIVTGKMSQLISVIYLVNMSHL